MARSRYQFRLHQLIKLVALTAIAFAILRSSGWPLILGVVLVIPGFAIDRARGGVGIVGSIVAGMVGCFGVGMVVFVREWLVSRPSSDGPMLTFGLLILLTLTGLIWGASFGVWAWLIVNLAHSIRPDPGRDKSSGPIDWRSFEDPTIPHAAAGGKGL